MEEDLSKLQYYVLTGKPEYDSPFKQIHDQAYSFWAEFWQKILLANQTTDKINPDEFCRQSFVTVLANRDGLAGMHCYTMFDLSRRADREHSYFKRYYTEKSLKALEEKGAARILTMEYFAVDKQWRSGKLGLSIGAVMACLGLKISREIGADAVISAARSDNASAKIGHSLGAINLDSDVMIYNTPCDLICFYPENIKFPADLSTRRLIDLFWANRIDTTDTTIGDKKVAQLPIVA